MLKLIKDISNELLSSFSCGINDLDCYLKKYAKYNDENGYGKTYLLVENNEIIGFFTVCSASIKFDEFPKNIKKNFPKYPIPSIRIARLAVNKKYQQKGYGKELLKLALIKSLVVSDTIGIRLVIVDAKESSKSFYEKYGFTRLIEDKLTYYLTIDTLRKAI